MLPSSGAGASVAAPMALLTDVMPDNTIRVLDHGFVRLDDGDGLRPLGRERRPRQLRAAQGGDGRIGRRVDPLPLRERHGTPFEHNAFRFHIRCPIFVAREWFRHRIGSFNEFSMRYAKATDDFYVPEPEDVRTQVGKPGAYSFEPVDPELAETTREELREVYDAGVCDVRAARRGGRRAGARTEW